MQYVAFVVLAVFSVIMFGGFFAYFVAPLSKRHRRNALRVSVAAAVVVEVVALTLLVIWSNSNGYGVSIPLAFAIVVGGAVGGLSGELMFLDRETGRKKASVKAARG